MTVIQTPVMKKRYYLICILILNVILAHGFVTTPVHAAGARDFLKAGKEAFNKDEFAEALNLLDKAIEAGTLAPQFASEAHYYKGRTYNKNGEPARGIADFTRALFFKDIPGDLRVKILNSRAQAYRSLGLNSQAQKDIASAQNVNVQATTVASAQAPKKPKASPQIPEINFFQKPEEASQQAQTSSQAQTSNQVQAAGQTKTPPSSSGIILGQALNSAATSSSNTQPPASGWGAAVEQSSETTQRQQVQPQTQIQKPQQKTAALQTFQTRVAQTQVAQAKVEEAQVAETKEETQQPSQSQRTQAKPSPIALAPRQQVPSKNTSVQSEEEDKTDNYSAALNYISGDRRQSSQTYKTETNQAAPQAEEKEGNMITRRLSRWFGSDGEETKQETRPIVGWTTSNAQDQKEQAARQAQPRAQNLQSPPTTRAVAYNSDTSRRSITTPELTTTKQHPSPSETGRYRLQLAAVASQADAVKMWSQLSQAHSSLLSGQTPLFEKVQKANNTMFRIQIGPYDDKVAAVQYCSSFKQRGVDCFVVTR